MSLGTELAVIFCGLHPREVLAGTPVLARTIARPVLRAVLTARAGGKPAPAKGAPLFLKEQAGPAEADSGEAARPEPARRVTAVSERLETLIIVGLVALVAFAALAPVVVLFARLAAPYLGGATGTLVIAWYLAAAMAAPPRKTTTQNDHEKLAGERRTENDGPAECQRAAERALVRLVLTEVRDAVADGRRGVLLAALLEKIDADWDVTTLRQHCQRLGIPTKKINIRGQGNTWGVHVEELESVLGGPVEDALNVLDATPSAGPAERAEEGPAVGTEKGSAQTGEETPAPAPPEAPARPPLAGLLGAAGAPSPGAAA
ncbi:hypothetical protein ABZ820_12685 [Streptomyces diacarni]|uniref:hypothetical protein n=1 Tax=Streptomyces diacarni TaxID=2800381 RepID=UPI0033D0A121